MRGGLANAEILLLEVACIGTIVVLGIYSRLHSFGLWPDSGEISLVVNRFRLGIVKGRLSNHELGQSIVTNLEYDLTSLGPCTLYSFVGKNRTAGILSWTLSFQ